MFFCQKSERGVLLGFHAVWAVLLLTVSTAGAFTASADLVDPGPPAVSTSGDGKYSLVPLEQFKHMGPIVASLDDLGSIVGNPNQRIIVGAGESVYIDVGTEHGVTAGDRFSIVVADRVIYPPPPVTDASYRLGAAARQGYLTALKNKIPFLRKPLGVMVHNLGTLEVVKSGGELSEAVIRESFLPIKTGARLIPYQEPVVPKLARDSKPVAKDIQGRIVAFQKNSMVAGMKDVVYIDKGEAGNVAAGDRFEVYITKEIAEKTAWYDEFPETHEVSWVIGELQVIATEKETAMAVVRKNRQEIFVGLQVRYVPAPTVSRR